MNVRFDRCLGTVHSLQPGEYTLRTASGSPALRCPSCGGIFDLPITHRFDDAGRVMPAVRCVTVTCPFFELVQLTDVHEEVVP